MKALSIGALLVLSLFINSAVQAQILEEKTRLSKQDIAGIQDVLKVLNGLDLRQMDKSTQDMFDTFFERKNQLTEPIQPGEKTRPRKVEPDVY